MTTTDRAAVERDRRAADRAARTEATLDMLDDRLPEYEPRVTFGALWDDVKHVRGILGRNAFYGLLKSLDHSHLSDDLIIRIAVRDELADSAVAIRPRMAWDRQRAYLRRFIARGLEHPPLPVSYRQAHARIRDERGPASAYDCIDCEDRAEEWAYEGYSRDEQIGWITTIGDYGTESETLRMWSPVPADYAPRCRRCHRELDESGVLWAAG